MNNTKNSNSISFNKFNKNNKIKNANLTNKLNIPLNFTNKNIANKDYKNNLLNFSTKTQMSILLKGLNIINNNFNKIIILEWKGNKKNFNVINKELNNKANTLLPLTKLESTNQIGSNINNIQNKSISKNMLCLKTINSKISTISNYFSDYKLLIQFNKDNNYKSFYNIQNYIKNLTKFNSKSAYSFSNNYNYKFNNSTIANNKLTKNLYIFLESSFYSMYCLISKPIFIITPEKVVIHLFYYKFSFLTKLVNLKLRKKNLNIRNNDSILKLNKNIIKLRIISQLLARYFRKPVEFEIIKLNYPYYNSNIFVKLLGFIINRTKLRIIKTKFFSKAKIINPTNLSKKNSSLPAYIAGIKIRIAGRLLTQRVIPRKTVKTFSKGSLARGKVIYLETARFTNKNKRGAFSITISTGHRNI